MLASARPENQEFFATAAQVIPVLFLAIVFEQRIWRGQEPETYFGVRTDRLHGAFGRLISVLIVLLVVHLLAGEAIALASISDGAGFASTYIVAGAMAFSGFLVVLPTLMLGLAGLAPESLFARHHWWDLKLGTWLLTTLVALVSLHTAACVVVVIVF